MAKRILIIDDEESLREMVEMRLRANGYDILTASNGQQGLEVLKNQRPDLILLDVLMPVMDGFEFFKHARRNPEYASIPIIMLTARGGMRGTFEALEADAFIPKPFDSPALLAAIAGLVANKALVLCNEPHALEQIIKAFGNHEHEVVCAPDETMFLERGRQERFSLVVIHAAFYPEIPPAILENIRSFRNKNPHIIIYSDASVKGTEKSDTHATYVIDEARIAWKKVGVDHFFDPRILNKSFADFIKNIITQ